MIHHSQMKRRMMKEEGSKVEVGKVRFVVVFVLEDSGSNSGR